MVILQYGNMTLSARETALMGLLSEGPMHAYRIEQEIKNRSMREWTEISMSSVYKLLKKLEKKGFIRGETRLSQNHVTQIIYRTTEKGMKTLRSGISRILSEPEKMVYRIDLATSHLDLLSRKEAEECLKEYRKKLEEGLACYKELEKYLVKCKCPVHSLALAKRPQNLIRGELEWLREYREDLAAARRKRTEGSK
ncbi:MAG: PadR family transcriptional regulator [bacterium]|nr:PadR family transcriptional regulator [bacterium]